MKPRLFIGCSAESLAIAEAIQQNLEPHRGEVTIWTQDIFRPSSYPLDDLVAAMENHHGAAFVFAPDDPIIVRGTTTVAVRDNVILEFGIAIGKVGRHRTFIVSPKGVPLQVASDLAGLTHATYDPDRASREPVPALAVASGQIITALRDAVSITYAAAGRYGVNLLSPSTPSTVAPGGVVSLSAVLPAGTSLRLELTAPGGVVGWGFNVMHREQWIVDPPQTGGLQVLRSGGSGLNDVQMQFSGTASRVQIALFENGATTATRTVVVHVG